MRLPVLLMLYCLILSTNTLFAGSVVVNHTGSTDPLSQGWVKLTGSEFPSSGSVGPVTYQGVDAWKINTNTGYDYYYGHYVDSAAKSAIESQGWRVSTSFRFADGTGDGPFSVFWYPEFGYRFHMNAITDDSSNTVSIYVSGADNLEAQLSQPLVSDEFTEIAFADTESDGLVDVWINGALVAQDLPLQADSRTHREGLIWFGEGFNATFLESHVAEVTLEVGPFPIPEPSSILLFSCFVAVVPTRFAVRILSFS